MEFFHYFSLFFTITSIIFINEKPYRILDLALKKPPLNKVALSKRPAPQHGGHSFLIFSQSIETLEREQQIYIQR